MKILATIIACVASLVASAALAAPVVWTLNGVTTQDGQTLTGSFTYDADTNVYSGINITSTGGVGPFTAISPVGVISASTALFIQTPTAVGQNGIGFNTAPKTNAGGTLTISTVAMNGGFFVCNDAGCTSATYAAGKNITAGTLVGAGAVASVPTMTEWAMILFGAILACGAAVYVQRRQAMA